MALARVTEALERDSGVYLVGILLEYLDDADLERIVGLVEGLKARYGDSRGVRELARLRVVNELVKRGARQDVVLPFVEVCE